MNSEHLYTALIDVLSYRYRLDRDIQTGNEVFREDLEQALSVFDGINTSVFGVQAISDTIILTCNSHERVYEFFEIIKKVFFAFMSKRLFIRGGVAYSKHFESGRITYSHAVAKAYELESKASIYPRIVVDENIVRMHQSSEKISGFLGNKTVLVQNGIYFLDVLDQSSWNDAYAYARLIYEQDRETILKNENAFLKHAWFENYLFSSDHADSRKVRYIESACHV
ncbi:hypothetical protein [Chromohalobacter israelensis]|uniref:Uncharacterized protein n=1 Tax=Chromohalobacter israelensis (strain ATCC BAA-138 / DSM 3043 / CIP 106854 / NCIMB 13768 / 1H11) TaxID=290398 RepID=Q1QUZ1_CHRI1|nr:hypothetical protein [Chromohalobacter salexigens]ABE59717.1 hypothetical protein Csal_2368 [Chromohalobacter salexigens DSM 3043]